MFAELRSHAWAYPALSVVHIQGIGLLLGNLTLLALRVFGKVRSVKWQNPMSNWS